MQLFSRIVGVLVLAAFAASSVGAQAFTLPAAQNTHPAGCHGHSLPTHAPVPLNHQCCIAGHNHAIPGSMFSGLTLLPYFGLAGNPDLAEVPYRFNDRRTILSQPSVGSPGPISLRI
jgi:hypothetical protein